MPHAKPRPPRRPRNPFAVPLRRRGHGVEPNKKTYTRKGRSKDRPSDR